MRVAVGICVVAFAVAACKGKTSAPKMCVDDVPNPAVEFAVQTALLERWCPEGNLHVIPWRSNLESVLPSEVPSGRGISSPLGLVRDIGPARPGEPIVVAADVIDRYRAVVCDAVREDDYDPENPTASPLQQRVALYDIDIAKEHQKPERVHSVLVKADLSRNTKAAAISFLGERVLELLDFGDRAAVVALLREALAKSHHLASDDLSGLSTRVGRLADEAQTVDGRLRERIRFSGFQWFDHPNADEPLLSAFLTVQ